MLSKGGMRTLQVMQVPTANDTTLAGFDALVVALKTRTCPVDEAVAQSLAAAEALLALGARQLFFKYCSTFDSTDRGNIGPVADALMARVDARLAVVCPAFPTNKRTIYMGNLFVGEVPLAESPMKDHPLTPMRDSSLVRVMQRQTQARVGLVSYPQVAGGAAAIVAAFQDAERRGERYVVVDAVSDQNLVDIGTAARRHKLITGGSGIALGLPANFVADGLLEKAPPPATMRAPAGRAAIISGSCSEATRGQVARAKAAGMPAFEVDPLALAAGHLDAAKIAQWSVAQPASGPILVYSSAEPAVVAGVQARLGRDEAGALVERTLAAAACQLVEAGFTRLIVAGGETSGAVVNGLGVSALEIGPEIDPGVPWTRAVGRDLVLALKSGNFGAPDFFLKAWERLA
jgi:uncharacterized protein YgbK (DUF1537 family)